MTSNHDHCVSRFGPVMDAVEAAARSARASCPSCGNLAPLDEVPHRLIPGRSEAAFWCREPRGCGTRWWGAFEIHVAAHAAPETTAVRATKVLLQQLAPADIQAAVDALTNVLGDEVAIIGELRDHLVGVFIKPKPKPSKRLSARASRSQPRKPIDPATLHRHDEQLERAWTERKDPPF